MAKAAQKNFPLLHIVLMILVIILIAGVLLLLKKTNMKYEKTTQTTVSSPTITSASFTCDEGKTIDAVFNANIVELNLSDGRSLLLTQGISGSGVRYTNWDESVTFWNKGNTAFLEEGPNDLTTYENCLQKP